jgi:superfamily I DNA/RNA helicase
MPAKRPSPTPKEMLAPFQPNPQQAAAIAHTAGPAAFIAAAGTGKTAILVQRLVRLIADVGVAPEAVLCVTFTRAAAEEMKQRAIQALRARGKLAKDLKGLHVTTFHGLGHLMLREKLGWTPQQLNKAIISGDPRQWLAEDILRPWRSNRTRGMNWDVRVADALIAVDRAKEGQIAPDAAAAFFQRDLLLDSEQAARYQEFYQIYEDTKKKQKVYDLADLIYIPLSLLESSPTYRKKWQGRFAYLQVDETQDTNPAQYRLIHHLAAPQQNVVVVGDPDQAIYSFRGASPEASILSFRAMYPKGKLYHIEHNYRSTPQILDAANRLIAQNPTTPGFEKRLRPTLPDGPPVVVTAYENQEHEAEGIAERIDALIREARARHDALSYKDIFVLSRTNHHLASLELVLARSHIPYRAVGGSSLFKRKTTRDMLAYLALADGVRLQCEYEAARHAPDAPRWEDVFTAILCGEQNEAFRTVAHIPSNAYFARTGKTAHRFPTTFFGTLASFSAGRPLLQYCEEQAYRIPSDYQLGVKDFIGLIHAVWERSHNHPAEAIQAVRELAYDAHLRHHDAHHETDDNDDAGDEAARHDDGKVAGRYDELDELTQIAGRHHTIRHFLQAMARLKEQAEDTSKNKRDCVALLTVHKSKGLEQQVVFVMGMIEGIFPHKRSFTLATEDGPIVLSGIPEERRLAYVACTRAQRRLFLSTILRYRNADATPSRFIAEAGLEPRDESGRVNPYEERTRLALEGLGTP